MTTGRAHFVDGALSDRDVELDERGQPPAWQVFENGSGETIAYRHDGELQYSRVPESHVWGDSFETVDPTEPYGNAGAADFWPESVVLERWQRSGNMERRLVERRVYHRGPLSEVEHVRDLEQPRPIGHPGATPTE